MNRIYIPDIWHPPIAMADSHKRKQPNFPELDLRKLLLFAYWTVYSAGNGKK